MRITRRIAAFLLAVAGWNVVTYAVFIRNLAATEGRPTGFYVAHTILIVVNLAIAAVLGVLGWRAWRAAHATDQDQAAPDRST
ncbi:MAG: SCO4848 family membrane protein [Actinopolymorphaceae bacterium]